MEEQGCCIFFSKIDVELWPSCIYKKKKTSCIVWLAGPDTFQSIGQQKAITIGGAWNKPFNPCHAGGPHCRGEFNRMPELGFTFSFSLKYSCLIAACSIAKHYRTVDRHKFLNRATIHSMGIPSKVILFRFWIGQSNWNPSLYWLAICQLMSTLAVRVPAV